MTDGDRLRAAYAHYILVKRCFDVRDGFDGVYVTARNMARARAAISDIEINQNRSEMDVRAIWREANQIADGYVPIESDIAACTGVYDDFRKAFPSTFRRLFREDKDF